MIISASYRTDIPCFYGEWFMNRLRAAHCKVVNPYSHQAYKISLRESDVDGFVFWTKNMGPFLRHLPEIRERGFPFLVQYTINAYPRELEHSVVDPTQSIENVKRIASEFGQKVVVWRYDPIVLSTLTPVDQHLATFAEMARALEGLTDEVVVSFAQIYRKTKRNMDQAAQLNGFQWIDPDDEVKGDLMRDLISIARSSGMQLSVCSQNQYVTAGAHPARCVDAERLSTVAGKLIAVEQKGNRPDCGCYLSKDIGEYDTCPHGCVYCYAVQHQRLARQRYNDHDPLGEFLFSPGDIPEKKPLPQGQLRFDL